MFFRGQEPGTFNPKALRPKALMPDVNGALETYEQEAFQQLISSRSKGKPAGKPVTAKPKGVMKKLVCKAAESKTTAANAANSDSARPEGLPDILGCFPCRGNLLSCSSCQNPNCTGRRFRGRQD